MEFAQLEEAVAVVEKAVRELEVDVLVPVQASRLLELFVKTERVGAAGKALVAPAVGDAKELARRAGTSVGKARNVLELADALTKAPALREAVRNTSVSVDQASEIAKTEAVAPGSAGPLLEVARNEDFHVLREEARKKALEAQRDDLADRQHQARRGGHRVTDLGMIRIEAEFEPHVGTPIVNRWEADARRLARTARREGRDEPFAAHLADALTAMLAGKGRGSTTRPEMVVVASHGVARRGWTDVRGDEVCKIPGVGPIPPAVARKIAQDAFLTGVIYDGKDLRQIRRWTRNIPVEVRLALELGDPPEFDGMRCVDCRARFRPERDHDDPHAHGGLASVENMKPRCWSCHKAKTEHDRRLGLLDAGGGTGDPPARPDVGRAPAGRAPP